MVIGKRSDKHLLECFLEVRRHKLNWYFISWMCFSYNFFLFVHSFVLLLFIMCSGFQCIYANIDRSQRPGKTHWAGHKKTFISNGEKTWRKNMKKKENKNKKDEVVKEKQKLINYVFWRFNNIFFLPFQIDFLFEFKIRWGYS